MQLNDNNELQNVISMMRLRSYSILTRNASIEELMGAYLWNIRVGAALFPLIQCLEVTLRNAIHNAATQKFGNSSWFDQLAKLAGNDYFAAYLRGNPDDEAKFYRNGVTRGSRNGRKRWTSKHESMLAEAKRRLTKKNKPHAADGIVAELMFGFWAGLFERNYNDLPTKRRLWPDLEPEVFPNLEGSERRHSEIFQVIKRINDLRNRVAHHEPIWKDSAVSDKATAISQLNKSIDDMLFIISGISAEKVKMLHESGLEGAARAVCSKDSLDFYVTGRLSKNTSIRRLKRDLRRHIDGKSNYPMTFSNGDRETVVLSLGFKSIT